MNRLENLDLLLLLLIGKHPTINNTYVLTRFFAKSSVLPDRLYRTLKHLVSQEYITIRDDRKANYVYKLSLKGENELKNIDTFDQLATYSIEIDKTGYICKMVFLLENKHNLVEVIDSFKFSDGRLIAFIKSDCGKLTDSTILENYQKIKWKIKSSLHVMGSIKTYEIIKQQEEDNTFQYLLEELGHTEKPAKGEQMRLIKNIS